VSAGHTVTFAGDPKCNGVWLVKEGVRKAVNVPNKLHFRKPGAANSATRYESLNNTRPNTLKLKS